MRRHASALFLLAVGLVLAGCGPARLSADASLPPSPVGQAAGWRLAFSDEFDGGSVDRAKWADRSPAEADSGRGNQGNQQLEWNQAANCAVAGGELRMTAKREAVTSPSGTGYGWTSCLLTTVPGYSFQYGYVEERAVLPATRGFWPALWTWAARGADHDIETDVYEYHSDNRKRLDLTQHSGEQGGCRWALPFDPTAGWHTYGAAIEPTGTTWYVDGAQRCHTDATSDGPTNVITNLAVYSRVPPDAATDSATKRVDYVRVWEKS